MKHSIKRVNSASLCEI